MLGREFRDDEEGPSAPATVMLSYSAWQTRFGADPNVLGRTVTLQSPWLSGGEPHVVIGVLPSAFYMPMAAQAEFWATIRGQQGCWDVRRCRSLEAVARLADDVSLEAASSNMTAVLEQLRADYPEHHREPEVARLVPLPKRRAWERSVHPPDAARRRRTFVADRRHQRCGPGHGSV